MPIIQKMLLTLLAIALLPAFAVTVIFYLNAQAYLHKQALSQLATIATIQRAQTEHLLEDRVELLGSFTSQLALLESIDRYNRISSNAAKEPITRALAETKAQIAGFNTISILSPSGEVIASTRDSDVGKSYAGQALFIAGLSQRDVTSNLFRSEEGETALYMVSPLKLEGRLIGVVVIESKAGELLASTRDYTGLGETGEVTLVKRTNRGDALYLASLRFDQTAALHRSISQKETRNPEIRALARQEGMFTDTVDYRGQAVLAVTHYIEAADWGLVVKMDRAEAYQPLTQLGNLLLVVMFILSVGIIILAFYLARQINAPILALAAVADKIRAGDLSQRATVTTRDEIGQLSSTFNAMASNFEKIDQMKTEFVLLTSHQLRTPATAVKGFMSMLLDGYAGPIPPKQRKILEDAFGENERQISVINSILDVAKMEAGEMELAPAWHDVGKIIEASAAGQAPLAAAQDQTITVINPKPAQKSWIDAEKLQLVLDNFIHNAIKYSPRGTKITVELKRLPKQTIITIADQGIGIAPKDKPRLFKRFSRLGGSRTATTQGAGLGLYLAKKLIHMQGGVIRVDSRLGEGTTFTIKLPNTRKAEAEPEGGLI